jgi:4-hydroxy-tetrahydrodipicolinate reductase
MAGAGRMGQAIVRAIGAHDDLSLAGLWVRDAGAGGFSAVPADATVSADIEAVVAAADVVIDFSLPEATHDVLEAARRHRKPLVCGVSGLGEDLLAELDAAARAIPLVYDRNMSLGIAVLDALVRQAAAALGTAFDVEVHETHHVHKVDAPSGTALKLGEALAAARGGNAADIRYVVERRGEVPGDHEVVFTSATETLRLAHSVTTRQVFADGALRAARWVVGQPPGRYLMRDVLSGTES